MPSNLPNLRRLFVEARTEAEESAYSRNAFYNLVLFMSSAVEQTNPQQAIIFAYLTADMPNFWARDDRRSLWHCPSPSTTRDISDGRHLTIMPVTMLPIRITEQWRLDVPMLDKWKQRDVLPTRKEMQEELEVALAEAMQTENVRDEGTLIDQI
ncbi:hypothetical protein B0A48_10701 [Cryoendolithus antarcticus]|uniref:Uncharacterized protein n=1 Tax=Cryoendolithus antarcticus TaxID=1507870 RepID=A0A1V8SYK5_9PEZI|nr:hypothetical protein B0A48_10701 [Cryoendolithus antarcticus]